jgi:hypothetical protein
MIKKLWQKTKEILGKVTTIFKSPTAANLDDRGSPQTSITSANKALMVDMFKARGSSPHLPCRTEAVAEQRTSPPILLPTNSRHMTSEEYQKSWGPDALLAPLCTMKKPTGMVLAT